MAGADALRDEPTGSRPAAAQVLQVGACSPLGLSSVQVALSDRALKLESRATDFVDQRGDHIGMVRARFLPDDLLGFGRLAALGAPALAEAACGLDEPAPLLLCLPEASRPDWDERHGGGLLRAITSDAGVAIDLEGSKVHCGGYAGFGAVLGTATRMLAGGVPRVIVGAVDSHYHPEVLAWLDRSDRLHSPGCGGGVVPAEGAAFAVLARAPEVAAEGDRAEQAGPPLAVLRWLRMVPGGLFGEDQAAELEAGYLREAASQLGRPLEWIWTDINGESARIALWSAVRQHCSAELAQSRQHRMAETMGDAGAAGGALGLAVVCRLWERGAADGASLLLALHGSASKRALLLFEDGTAAATAQREPERKAPSTGAGVPALHHVAPSAGVATRRDGVPVEGSRDGAAVRNQLLWSARDCLSDLASLWACCSVLPSQPWHVSEPFEKRLLASLDALIALAQPTPGGPTELLDLGDTLSGYLKESRVPDRGRQFTAGLVRGCLLGDVGVRAAMVQVLDAPVSTHGALEIAFSLVPHPGVDELALDLMHNPRPALTRLGLRVARFRRALSFDRLAPLRRHRDPSLRLAAAQALGFVPERQQAVESLAAMLADRDEEVALEAETSLLRLGSLEALAHARQRLVEPIVLPDEVRLTHLRTAVLSGGADDWALVRGAVQSTPYDAELVGWFGDVGLVDWLLERLAAPSEQAGTSVPSALQVAAVSALVRITGAPGPDGQASGDLAGLADEPQRWFEWFRQWWREQRDRFDGNLRFRWGRPYQPLLTLAELGGDMPAGLRDDGALELDLMVGPTAFEPGDWVARQRQVLTALEQRCRERAYPPGSWPASQLGY